MNRVSLQPGYILHRRPYRNSSLLLEVFTEDHGRVGLVSRGGAIGRTKGGQRLLNPLQAMFLSWTQRGELGTLTDSELCANYVHYQGDSLLAAMYLNELLLKLLPRHIPEPEIFRSYGMTLEHLAAQTHVELYLRIFEKRLLESLGYALTLDVDSQNRQIIPEHLYLYHEEQGAVRVKAISSDIRTYHGKTLLDLHGEQFSNEHSLREAKHLLRAILNLHVGQRGIKMRDLFSTKL